MPILIYSANENEKKCFIKLLLYYCNKKTKRHSCKKLRP